MRPVRTDRSAAFVRWACACGALLGLAACQAENAEYEQAADQMEEALEAVVDQEETVEALEAKRAAVQDRLEAERAELAQERAELDEVAADVEAVATDGALVDAVERAFAEDPLVEMALASIGIRAEHGVVYLTGTANTEPQREKAGEIARAIPGVAAVKNELVLKPGS